MSVALLRGVASLQMLSLGYDVCHKQTEQDGLQTRTHLVGRSAGDVSSYDGRVVRGRRYCSQGVGGKGKMTRAIEIAVMKRRSITSGECTPIRKKRKRSSVEA